MKPKVETGQSFATECYLALGKVKSEYSRLQPTSNISMPPSWTWRRRRRPKRVRKIEYGRGNG